MRIEDALDRFVQQLRADGRSDHTIRQYQRHVLAFRRWLGDQQHPDDIAATTHEVVAAFFVSPAVVRRADGGERKPTSANAIRSSLRNFYRYLHAAGAVAADPCRLIRRARCAPPPPRGLTEDEQHRLFGVLDEAETDKDRRDAVLFKLLFACALRLGSAIALDVRDVDLLNEELHLHQMKGSRPDRVIIPQTMVAELRQFIGGRGDGPLFQTRRGRLTARHAHRRFAQICQRAGLSRVVSPHALRHTRATALYRRTQDIHIVQTALRHKSVASTLIYARLDDTRLRTALNE